MCSSVCAFALVRLRARVRICVARLFQPLNVKENVFVQFVKANALAIAVGAFHALVFLHTALQRKFNLPV